ncbi:MAG: alpha/beta hydrolase [Cyclobacteriaceae bacterium]|nr:alpha/beta hydrolase [Cyclobacteriaceae bacterium]
MKKYLLLLLLIRFLPLHAQNGVAMDTSYTVNSEYAKRIKKYPFIEIKKPVQHKSVSEISNVVYKQTQNHALHLDAFYYNKKKHNPIVVLVHGGGWKSGNKSLMIPLAEDIAAKGYACFTVEYRLSPEAQYPAAVNDVKQAIQFVKAHAQEYNADSSRVAVLGCSSGGQMAALIGATNNTKRFESETGEFTTSSSVQAVIDLDGILAFHHPQSKEGTAAAQWLGGTYNEIPNAWDDASALTHTDENMPPILFINSQYPRFHAGREEMIDILSSHGIYYKVETIEDSPHTFWLFNPWYDTTLNYIISFLNTVFK